MKTRQLKVLEDILSYGIRVFINGLKLRFVSHLSNDEPATRAISTLADKIDNELKDVPKILFENSKLISDVYYKSTEDYKFDKPEQLFGTSQNILEDSFALTLRYAVIYEALQVISPDYPANQKQVLENSLKMIETESKEIQAIFKRINDESLAESVHDSIVILKAVEQNISIEEADEQQRKRW